MYTYADAYADFYRTKGARDKQRRNRNIRTGVGIAGGGALAGLAGVAAYKNRGAISGALSKLGRKARNAMKRGKKGSKKSNVNISGKPSNRTSGNPPSTSTNTMMGSKGWNVSMGGARPSTSMNNMMGNRGWNVTMGR
jgi:hypothetical protein